jgi:predicted nuclease of predicted toxin-antitoxin system
MDFYFDEQLPKTVANALDVSEQHEKVHRVFSTEMKFGKGVKDITLYKKLKEVNGILITHDLKMITRIAEFTAIKEPGITVFFINLPGGVNFTLLYQTLFEKWEEIKQISRKEKHPFVCKIKMKGKTEFL